MTTEKEFWNLAGQYFRKELGISEDEQSIDEGCVGCAGPCKVVDVAAKLQEELDEACGIIASKDRVLVNLHKTIEDLKDRNIDDLKELYDFHEGELEWFKDVISGLETDLRSAKSDYKIMRTNHYNTVAKLRGDIRGLEVEFSTCIDDSEVLMKVVEIIRDNGIYPHGAMNELADLLVDYLDAPEGPPETPINDLYKVTVSCAFLEMP